MHHTPTGIRDRVKKMGLHRYQERGSSSRGYRTIKVSPAARSHLPHIKYKIIFLGRKLIIPGKLLIDIDTMVEENLSGKILQVLSNSHRELHQFSITIQAQFLCFNLKHEQRPKDHLIFKESLQDERKSLNKQKEKTEQYKEMQKILKKLQFIYLEKYEEVFYQWDKSKMQERARQNRTRKSSQKLKI